MKYRAYIALTLPLVVCGIVLAQQQFFSRDRSVSAHSQDPMGDVMEVAVAFGNLYGFDGIKFGITMGGVFGVECRYLQRGQNCMGFTGTYQGSFQHGRNEQREGISMARQAIPYMVRQGNITPEQAKRFTAALDAAQGSRMHHLANTLAAVARHAPIAGPLQKQYTQPQDLAAAHEAFQFASSLRARIIYGTRGGLAGPAPNFGNNCNASGRGSVLQAIQRIATGKCAHLIARGIAEASALTGAPVPPYDPNQNYFADSTNTNIFNNSTNGGLFAGGGESTLYQQNQTVASPINPFGGGQTQLPYTPPYQTETANQNSASYTGGDFGASQPLASGPREYAPFVPPPGNTLPTYYSAAPEVIQNIQQDIQNGTASGGERAPEAMTGSAQTTNVSNSVQTPKTPAATIACVMADGKARVRWSCPASASVSRGLASPKDKTFTTRGALAGVVHVSPTALTTYTVQCIQNQHVMGSESCKLKPPTSSGTSVRRNTVLSLSVVPEAPYTLRRGRRATLSWSTIRARACTVSGEGLAAEGESGEEQTDPLTRAGTYTYVLECETPSGDTETARVRVTVQ